MIDCVASWIRTAERIVILTGAGLSAESGVPVFRGAGGLWRQFRPEQLATPEAFARQPELVWEWYLWRRAQIAQAMPNAGHETIARWQRQRQQGGCTVLTQNVDGLHARAGSPAPTELHGNVWRVRCTRGCGFRAEDIAEGPPRTQLKCGCGAWLRADVVWFGEPLAADDIESAVEAAESAELMLVVGTSAVVYPVAMLPQIARQHGARVVEVNIEPTPLSDSADAVLRGPAAEVLPALDRAS